MTEKYASTGVPRFPSRRFVAALHRNMDVTTLTYKFVVKRDGKHKVDVKREWYLMEQIDLLSYYVKHGRCTAEHAERALRTIEAMNDEIGQLVAVADHKVVPLVSTNTNRPRYVDKYELETD